ncbi:MAG: hypothetical protein SGCHY_003621 [Lobulomycetales sp.]
METTTTPESVRQVLCRAIRDGVAGVSSMSMQDQNVVDSFAWPSESLEELEAKRDALIRETREKSLALRKCIAQCQELQFVIESLLEE